MTGSVLARGNMHARIVSAQPPRVEVLYLFHWESCIEKTLENSAAMWPALAVRANDCRRRVLYIATGGHPSRRFEKHSNELLYIQTNQLNKLIEVVQLKLQPVDTSKSGLRLPLSHTYACPGHVQVVSRQWLVDRNSLFNLTSQIRRHAIMARPCVGIPCLVTKRTKIMLSP